MRAVNQFLQYDSEILLHSAGTSVTKAEMHRQLTAPYTSGQEMIQQQKCKCSTLDRTVGGSCSGSPTRTSFVAPYWSGMRLSISVHWQACHSSSHLRWNKGSKCISFRHMRVFLEMLVQEILLQQHNNNNCFTALCPGLPMWAGTRRNIHPPTILIIIRSLSASSIYHDP